MEMVPGSSMRWPLSEPSAITVELGAAWTLAKAPALGLQCAAMWRQSFSMDLCPHEQAGAE